MADPVIQLPHRIISIDEDLPIRLQRNFDEIVRLLGMLQTYENKTGKVINQQVADNSDIWDRANNITAEGKWLTSKLEGAIDTALNLVLAGAGNVTITDNNGILIVDNKDAPTKALRLLGGVFAIANSKDQYGDWQWKTFGTGDGFVADMLTSGKILTSLINIVGDKYYTKILGDGFRVYDKTGSLAGHFGHYQTLADQIATFTRASVASKSDGTQVAANQPRFEYHTLSAPIWRDTFDTDQLSKYTSGGNVAGIPTVSGGVLTYTGGTQATLIKNDLLLQDCEIVVDSDQSHDGGIVARWQDNNNYYLLALRDDSGAVPTRNLEVFKRVGGTFTGIAYANVTWPRGTSKQIKFSCKGSRLEAYFDGVKVISVTDTTFTGGSVGLQNSSSTAFRVLDFTVYYAQQGAMGEEANANLVRTNAGADPLFNSATGWGLSNATIANGVLTLQSPDGSTVAMASCTLTNLAQNTKHSFLIRARYKDTTGTANNLELDLYASGYDNVEQQLSITPSQLTAAFQNFKKDGFDSQSAPSSVQLRIFTFSTRPIEVEFVQLEQKAFSTSIMDGSRVAEVLTAPSSVFQKGNWTVKLRFTPKSNSTLAVCWGMQIDANNWYRMLIYQNGNFQCSVKSGGVEYGANGASGIPLSSGLPYFISFCGNGSNLYLFVNGVQIGTAAYVEPVGTLPANMYIGSSGSGSLQANGIISDFAVMSKAQTLAEHQAEYNSGLPLTYDENTTLLMSMDGTLQPTVRDFGLFTKNGRIVLQDPQKGQGIEVWDGDTRKVLIGRLDDDTIGQEIVGGALYSSLFRTGAKADKTYIALVPPNLLQVWSNVSGTAKQQLEIAAPESGGGGGIDFYYDDTFAGQVKVQSGDFRVSSVNSSYKFSLIGPNTNKIELKTNNGIDYTAGSNYHRFFGDLHMGSGTKYNVEETVNYGKRLLAVRESPEQKYIDEGKNILTNGECTIFIDPIFIECIEPDTADTPWLIHLTTYADVGIYVAEIGADYFVVKERNGGTSNSVFVWSLSATRKNHAFDRLPEVV